MTISNLALRITDKDSGANIVNLTQAGGDFTENTFDGNVYFVKSINGISGGRVLTGRVSFTYAQKDIIQDVLFVSRGFA